MCSIDREVGAPISYIKERSMYRMYSAADCK